MAERPAIPSPVKRLLRQEAAFGCCLCGHPLMQYHHIVPYSVEPHFRPEDMMALCPNHHELANDGALPIDQQRAAKATPYNRQHGHVKGQLYVNQLGTKLCLGGQIFDSAAGDLLRIDDEMLIRTAISEDGALLLSVRLFDEGGTLLAEIDENEWISHEPLPWDIEHAPQRLSVKSAERKVALDVNCKVEPVLIRGELWYGGQNLKARKNALICGGATIQGGGTFVNGAIQLSSDEGGVSILPMQTRPPTKLEQVMAQARERQARSASKSKRRKKR